MRAVLLIFCAAICSLATKASEEKEWKAKTEKAEYVHRAIKQMTDVMVHDIYSPPVASRTYAYICIAGYEAAIHDNPAYQSLAGQLRGLKNLPKPDKGEEYSYTLAAVHAILTVGRTMVISEKTIEDFYKSLLAELKEAGMPDAVFSRSIAYGQQIADHILAWAAEDNYKQTRTFTKYTIDNDAATWKPTPPSYMKAVEPHWNKLRPFLIDSAQQFKPLPPTKFSADKESRFYKEALEVRDRGLNLTPDQKEAANFWDCNPFKMNLNGHVMYASKKISPGGHWMNITRLACQKTGLDVVASLEAYACLSITIADAFISCWDEKYRSKVIRPETYINQYIDESWMPLLQTPPFPEYTSGHSVLSAASAVVLGKIFGENFAFTDSTETEFGIPVRRFASFRQAAEEAAISRLYGGIHYMPSIMNGTEEGKKIGTFVNGKLRTRKRTFK
ncbi:vanadium-dependent haloperoxidase [Flavisolibacter nicotianae]|uniref:vanadium-dependent haloperoxidase n=1 Tax=Flavisolibacter nicotianae TaxID=2364882 RepID=UPI000EAB9DA1|nr:vanadium-dependent haloperoxidase [Flavisolibacter nicotianae]